jgi:hypothetical protein
MGPAAPCSHAVVGFEFPTVFATGFALGEAPRMQAAAWARGRVLLILVGLLGAAAVVCRVWALDRLPGLNADEAWLNVRAIDFLAGKSIDLYTPSGNPLNPFLALPVLLLEALRSNASILNLRIATAIAGISLMVLSYPLTRKVIGAQCALVFTLLVWVMPAHIAYGRMGWDASETPLVALLCLASLLHRRTHWMVLSTVAAVWVHPTNVFLVPILAGGMAGQVIWERRRLTPGEWAWVGCGLLAVAAFFVWRVFGSASFPHGSPEFFSRDFLTGLVVETGRFLSGVTTLQYIVGPMNRSVVLLFDFVFWSAVLILLLTGLPERIRTRDGMVMGLILGTLVALVVVAASGGLLFVIPGFERYALFLTVPSCYIFASLLVRPTVAHDAAEARPSPSAAVAIALVASFLWLGVFIAQYHVKLETRGSRSYALFNSGEQEPKAAAFALIEADAEAGPVLIIAENYWTYWPMRYFGARDSRIQVELFNAESARELITPRYASHAVFAVGFSKGALAQSIERGRSSREWGRPVWKQSFNDPQDLPILDVWRLR